MATAKNEVTASLEGMKVIVDDKQCALQELKVADIEFEFPRDYEPMKCLRTSSSRTVGVLKP